MIETRVTFKGIDQLHQALEQLPVEVQKTVLRTGLRYGAAAIKAGMVRRAPRAAEHRIVRGGRNYPIPLADSIVARVLPFRAGQWEAKAEVGPSKQAYWGTFVELGTRFQAARSFMKRTVDEDGQIVVAATAAGLKDELERVVRRLKRS